MIVSSTFTEGPDQGDGRRYVREVHTDDQGQTYTHEWLGAQAAAPVVEARAQLLGRLLDEQRAAAAFVAGTRLPLTKYQFRQIFTAEERGGVDAFETSFESNPGLPAATKALIRTGFKDFNASGSVTVPFVPGVLQMLGLFVALGLLSQARMDEIVAAHSG